ncbi:hypothetical protein B0H50_102133 [Hallerella porci]|uniref:DUF1302 domain-containing protein n=2 Tax=Fibrobacteraceae TaxID=204431 RepID=A0ABX5LPA6_9BACT|nr:hypothetical protein B0H50_102133 [Hallerella porci]
MKKNMNKFLIAFLAAAVTAPAATEWQTQEKLNAKVDSINAKRGVEIGGKIRAIAQTSYFDTDQDPNGTSDMPETERNEMANADIDFHFRPFENVRANVMLRMGAGMQEYFSSASKTLSVGWLNVEGNIGKDFYWVVGDFRQQYTPLTLFSPDVEILYEPLIFARKRHMAESQELLDGNQRNLQGANVQFRHYFGSAVGELRVEALAARLNRTSVLDLSAAEGNILPNDSVAGASQASNMDKWVIAGNLELLPMDKNLYVGVTPMYIFDNKDSRSYTYRHQGLFVGDPYEMQDINPFEIDPQKTTIVSGRVGGDVAGILGNKNLVLDLVAEYAYSSDETYKHEGVPVIDMTTGLPAVDEEGNAISQDVAKKKTLNGSALLVNMNVGYKMESDWGVVLGMDIVRNDSNWFNNLAQSPKFFARRILNSDIDGETIKYGVNSPLYSSFDALYNYSPKFSPVARTLGTDDGALSSGQSKSYNIAPFNKSSWKSNVYTRAQLALIEQMSDPALQLSLPNGLATSNRQGGRGNLKFNWKDYAEVQAMGSYFMQVSALSGYKEAKYLEFGGGAKVDVFKMLGFQKPLEISGSYKHSERKIDTDGWGDLGLTDGTAELKSDFINAGLYVQYLPRLGFTAGFQYIKTDYNTYEGLSTGLKAPLMSGKQMQWMVGLDYTLAKDAWLSINYGRVSVKNEYNTAALVADNASGNFEQPYNLPSYYDVTTDASGKFKHEFSQAIVEASINVEF